MKLEQNDKSLLFSETTIPDIFFSEHLSEIPGDFLKIYMYVIFLFFGIYGLLININVVNHLIFFFFFKFKI